MVLPTYIWIHKQAPFLIQVETWNFSQLDELTLAAVLEDDEIVYFVLLVTALYTILAYYFLFGFCYEMSQTEFTSAEQFIERFVAKHAVFIRGVNTQIGTEVVRKKVTRVFEQRFGKSEVVACHAYKKSLHAQKTYKQIKLFKYKLDELEEKA